MDWINVFLDPSVAISVQSLKIQKESFDLSRASFFLSIVISIFSVLGIGAALWTAYLTRKAVNSAGKALKLSHSIGRAWLAHSDYRSGALTDSILGGVSVTNGIIVRVIYKNSGQTPALQVRAHAIYSLIKKFENGIGKLLDDSRTLGQMVIAPGEERHFDILLGDCETTQLRDQTHDLLIEVVIDYKTVAEELGIRRTRLSYRAHFNQGTIATGGQESGILTAISGPLGDFCD